MRKVKKEKRGNCSVGIFWAFEREITLKRKEKKGERKEWKGRIPPGLGNNPKMMPFKTNIYHFVSFWKFSSEKEFNQINYVYGNSWVSLETSFIFHGWNFKKKIVTTS